MEAAIEFNGIFGDDEEQQDLDFNTIDPTIPGSHLSLVPSYNPNSSTPWPPALVFDLALGLDPTLSILERHGVTTDQYEKLLQHPLFRKEIASQVRLNQENGLTFQRRAQAIAEECLPDMYTLIKDPTVAASTRADVFKYVTKVGNLEPKDKTGGAGTNGMQVQININI